MALNLLKPILRYTNIFALKYATSTLISTVFKQRFALETSSDSSKTATGRVDTWDGWRGTAIFLVLCGHFYDIEWIWEDRLGVDIFFVLSGMLMSAILFDKRLSLKDFYIRRLSRIYPALLTYVIAIYSFSWLQNHNFSFSEVISSLLFLRTYFPAEPGIWSSEVAVGHLWSLNVEEHAYVLLSLLTVFFIRKTYIGLLLLALGTISVFLGLYKFNTMQMEEFPLYLIRTESAIVFIFFSAGYGLLKRQGDWNFHYLIPLICLAGAFVCYLEDMPIWLVFSVSPILLSIAVNHLDNIPKLMSKVLTFKPLRYLGILSYSIYLWQQFFFVYHWAYPIPKPTLAILAIATGMISFYLIENPARRAINSRWSSSPAYRPQD